MTQKAITSVEQLIGFFYNPRVRDATPSLTLPLQLRGDVSRQLLFSPV